MSASILDFEYFDSEPTGFWRWSRTRWFGRNRIVRSSYLWLAGVPIAARLVRALQAQVVEPGWAQQVVHSLHLPFSWKILFTASLLWAIATALFDLRCPEIIRDYASLGDFLAQHKQHLHLERLADMVAEEPEQTQFPFISREEIDRRLAANTRTIDLSPFPFGTQVRRLGKSACVHDHPLSHGKKEFRRIHYVGDQFGLGDTLNVNEAFWHVWGATEVKRRISMKACLSAYVAGSVMALWVLGQNVIWVLREVW